MLQYHYYTTFRLYYCYGWFSWHWIFLFLFDFSKSKCDGKCFPIFQKEEKPYNHKSIKIYCYLEVPNLGRHFRYWETDLLKIYILIVAWHALADARRTPPRGSRFFRFDMQNFQNVTASGVHAPPPPPPTGNPGSATGMKVLQKLTCCVSYKNSYQYSWYTAQARNCDNLNCLFLPTVINCQEINYLGLTSTIPKLYAIKYKLVWL